MEMTEKFRTALRQLEKIVTCPVCLEPLTTDIAQCITGHAICIPCRTRIVICPSCKKNFLAAKPTTLVQVLELLPRPCQYAEEGCQIISFSRNHDRFCGYRSYKCSISMKCSWEGTVKNFKAHVQREHNSEYASYMVGSLKKLLHRNFNKNTWLQQEYLHLVDDNLFLVTALKERKRQVFIQTVRHISIEEPMHTYHFVITIMKKGIVYKHTIKAVEYDQCESVANTPHSMTVPLEEVISFVNCSGCLEVTFLVTKTLIEK